MKKILLIALIAFAASCSKKKENCMWSCNGDYYPVNKYSKADAERLSKCECSMICEP